MPTTLSKSLSNLSPTEPREKAVRELFHGLCRQPQIHARFLNTLSLLEHIGSRKILASQENSSWGENILGHLAEETRHAHFFRRAANKIANRTLDYSNETLLAPSSARIYLGRLDALVTRELVADRHLAYRYVTLAVELRAQWFYGIYEEILRSDEIALTLNSVIAEEDGHLRDMTEALSKSDPNFIVRKETFAALETNLFDKWLMAVCRASLLQLSSPAI